MRFRRFDLPGIVAGRQRRERADIDRREGIGSVAAGQDPAVDDTRVLHSAGQRDADRGGAAERPHNVLLGRRRFSLVADGIVSFLLQYVTRTIDFLGILRNFESYVACPAAHRKPPVGCAAAAKCGDLPRQGHTSSITSWPQSDLYARHAGAGGARKPADQRQMVGEHLSRPRDLGRLEADRVARNVVTLRHTARESRAREFPAPAA